MALKPPVEVPQGAIRFNTDSQKLEFFAEDQWWQMATTVSGGSGRGLHFAGEGQSPIGYTNVINYIQINTEGNAIDFGDMTASSYEAGANSSYTRAVHTLGYNGSSYVKVIEYVTMATAGNAIDFGDTLTLTSCSCHQSDGVRDVIMGGYAPSGFVNNIEYITIASLGNSIDAGDVTFTGNYGAMGVNSHTRGIHTGASNGPHGASNTIDFVTIQSLGDAVDFGDCTVLHKAPGGTSNGVRGLVAGGNSGPSPSPHGVPQNTIDMITIATTGNAQDFGDMSQARSWLGGLSSPTRAVWMGGQTPTRLTTMDYNYFVTLGNATDFGDLTHAMQSSGNASDVHGGL